MRFVVTTMSPGLLLLSKQQQVVAALSSLGQRCRQHLREFSEVFQALWREAREQDGVRCALEQSLQSMGCMAVAAGVHCPPDVDYFKSVVEHFMEKGGEHDVALFGDGASCELQ